MTRLFPSSILILTLAPAGLGVAPALVSFENYGLAMQQIEDVDIDI